MLVRLFAFVCLSSLASAQQFVRNTTDVPSSSGDTEQVDFADVDLDGDWDAGFANGGDHGNQQNVLWINQGGTQGGVLGAFTNATATRFPAIADSSRDIEFADYDSDGDPDVYSANHASIVNQGSRLWTNQGGAQGGNLGFFVDETVTRWVGLGTPGSSIPPQQVMGSGGFIEFAHECDFADVDNDGDLDFVQATWGGAASGNAPTRIFLNDGSGIFTEFNPSGYQLPGASIMNGAPGLWCEGTQSANTTDSSGANCDIATTAPDADWADVDGDLDIDMILGALQESPRLFQNRLQENGGTLGFRDVTGASFQANYATGFGHYEQCFADFDGDDDLDLYGVNWAGNGASFDDNALRNSSTGFFADSVTIPLSAPDDQSAEPIDYDLDGDLDIFVSNFSGQDRLVDNGGVWGSFTDVTSQVPVDSLITLDSDAADVDADGDYDLFSANGNNASEWYLQNTTAANDSTAPRIARLEQAANRAAGLLPTVVRCQIYDNVGQELAQWLSPVLELRLDGVPQPSIAMRASFAQIFRGAIPGHLVGAVEYRVLVADEHGNTASSAWLTYLSGLAGTAFCSGDGTGTPCPCGNDSTAGRGCANSLGTGARLIGVGTASVTNDAFTLSVSSVPNSSVLFFQGTAQVAGGAGSTFGDGLRCAGGTAIRIGTKSAAGNLAEYPQGADVPVSIRGLIPAQGGVRTYQAWYRNAASFCTPSTFNLSNGWEVTWTL